MKNIYHVHQTPPFIYCVIRVTILQCCANLIKNLNPYFDYKLHAHSLFGSYCHILVQTLKLTILYRNQRIESPELRIIMHLCTWIRWPDDGTNNQRKTSFSPTSLSKNATGNHWSNICLCARYKVVSAFAFNKKNAALVGGISFLLSASRRVAITTPLCRDIRSELCNPCR